MPNALRAASVVAVHLKSYLSYVFTRFNSFRNYLRDLYHILTKYKSDFDVFRASVVLHSSHSHDFFFSLEKSQNSAHPRGGGHVSKYVLGGRRYRYCLKNSAAHCPRDKKLISRIIAIMLTHIVRA